jgi:hypothetical protein
VALVHLCLEVRPRHLDLPLALPKSEPRHAVQTVVAPQGSAHAHVQVTSAGPLLAVRPLAAGVLGFDLAPV